jgi:hypothetical protein
MLTLIPNSAFCQLNFVFIFIFVTTGAFAKRLEDQTREPSITNYFVVTNLNSVRRWFVRSREIGNNKGCKNNNEASLQKRERFTKLLQHQPQHHLRRLLGPIRRRYPVPMLPLLQQRFTNRTHQHLYRYRYRRTINQ